MNNSTHDKPDYQLLRELFPKIIWDYHYNSDELCRVIDGSLERSGPFTREQILLRMIERLWWYDIIFSLGKIFLSEHLTPALLSKIRHTHIRDQYDRISKILHGEPVSFSGWSPEYRQAIGATIFSHRWDRT